MTMTVKRLSDVIREVWHPLNLIPSVSKIVEQWVRLGASPPRYSYLTASYAEAMGLIDGPIALQINRGYVAMGDGGCLPPPGASGYATGFEFDGWLYGREFDGLAYRIAGIAPDRREGLYEAASRGS